MAVSKISSATQADIKQDSADMQNYSNYQTGWQQALEADFQKTYTDAAANGSEDPDVRNWAANALGSLQNTSGVNTTFSIAATEGVGYNSVKEDGGDPESLGLNNIGAANTEGKSNGTSLSGLINNANLLLTGLTTGNTKSTAMENELSSLLNESFNDRDSKEFTNTQKSAIWQLNSALEAIGPGSSATSSLVINPQNLEGLQNAIGALNSANT